HLDKIEELQSTSGVPVIQIQFSDPSEPGWWVRTFLVRLPHRRLTEKITECVELLSYRSRDRYQLCLLRHPPFTLDTSSLGDRQPQVYGEQLLSEVESTLKAAVRIWSRKDNYSSPAWVKGEEFLLDTACSTYLGKLFSKARGMLQISDKVRSALPGG